MFREFFKKFVDDIVMRMDNGAQPGTPIHNDAAQIAETLHERFEAMEVRIAALEARANGVTAKF